MKKLFVLTILAALISGSSMSQSEYCWQVSMKFYPRFNNSNQKGIEKNKIKSIEQTETKNGKVTRRIVYTFNQNGTNDSYISFGKKGKMSARFQYEYPNQKYDQNHTFIGFNSKNKETDKEVSSWDSLTNHREISYFSKGNLNKRITWDYYTYLNKDDKKAWNITKSELFGKNNEIEKRWEYSYYPDHSKKTSVIYNSKGKVKYTWNYDCKSEGELVQKHKDTTLVCKNKDTDANGNTIVTERKFDEKGHPQKIVTRYNKDGKIVSYQEFGEDDRPSYWVEYNTQLSQWSDITTFDKNGEEKERWNRAFDANGNLIESCKFSHGEETESTTHNIDDKGLTLSSKTIKTKKNGKQEEFITEYKYTFY